MARKHSMDLTSGSVMKKLIAFAFPLWLSNLVQQFYHAADVIVVGNFAQDSTSSLAAVGSTGSITTLILHLFLGLAVGASVRCANLFGAGDKAGLRRAMVTSIITAVCSGVLVAAVGFFLARPLLELMGSPESVIDEATIYMQIIFLGKPAVLVYNTCSGIMRAHGEAKRPMYILTATGLVNVVLNLVLVIVFHLDAAGVALATIVSQWLSAVVSLYLMFHPMGEYKLKLSEFSFCREEFFRIVKIGVPAGINGMVFSLSNVIVISTVNSLGAVTVAAVSAATSVATIVYTLPSSFSTACVSFAGQNYGAKKFDRIDKLLWSSILIVEVIFFTANLALTLFPEFFLGLYTDETDVIQTAIPKLMVTCWGYLIYSVSEMANGCQRGFGKTMGPTIINMISVCVPRIFWVIFVFPHLEPNLLNLYTCFPISWAISATAQVTSYYIASRRKKRAALAEANS